MQKISELAINTRYSDTAEVMSEKHRELRENNRQKMQEEGSFYELEYCNLITSGYRHNDATLQAVYATTKNFNPEGTWQKTKYHKARVNVPRAEKRQRGRLVYIGAYRRLEFEYKTVLGMTDLLGFLSDKIDGFVPIGRVLEEATRNPTQLARSILRYLELSDEHYWYEELKTQLEKSIVRA